MNTRLFIGLIALATAGLSAIGCGSTASYTETEDDHVQSNDEGNTMEAELESVWYPESEPDDSLPKPKK